MTDLSDRSSTRTKIIEVAAELLRAGGPAAVTTRGVAEAAGVQAPAIYRQFGDKDGLLEAVAEHVMASFVAAKTAVVAAAVELDPVDDLRAGWLSQIEFGLDNPSLFRLLSDPDRVAQSAAAQSGRDVLELRVHRIAAAGRLRVGEQRAIGLIQAAGIGTIQTLLSTPPEQRDAGLADSMFEAVLGQILTDAPLRSADGSTAAIVAVRAIASQLDVLSAGERALLAEWLDRAVDVAQDRQPPEDERQK